MKTRDIKTRRPWRLIRPEGYYRHGAFNSEIQPLYYNLSILVIIIERPGKQFEPSTVIKVLTRLKKTGERYQNVYEKILGSLGASGYTVESYLSPVFLRRVR